MWNNVHLNFSDFGKEQLLTLEEGEKMWFEVDY